MGGGRGFKEERGAVSEVLSACLGAGWWWFGGRHGAERGGLVGGGACGFQEEE